MGTEIIVTEPRIESKFQTDIFGFNNFKNIVKDFGFVKSFNKRIINSLYYDDFKYSSVADNLSGITPRSKFRLRWYSDLNNKNYGLRFEQKIKQGLLGIKKIINLSEYTQNICDDFSIKNISLQTNIFDISLLPLQYYPQIFCQYIRSYYENKDGVRLTIDQDIKFRNATITDNLFKINSNQLSSNIVIFEVKFSENQKSMVIPLLRKMPSTSNRCSKYLLAQSKLRHFSYI